MPPPIDCPQKLTHPLHTFAINTLCPQCQEERDLRIQAFETHMREDLEQRISTRSEERNERGSDFGRRRLFRASTTLAMIMDAQNPAERGQGSEIWDGDHQVETLKSSTAETVGKIVDGFRGLVGFHGSGAGSSPLESRGTSVKPSANPPCSPAAPRLSFAALAGATLPNKVDRS